MLQFFNEANQNSSLTELVSSHNGYTGGSFEKKFYLRNDEADKYYTNIEVVPVFANDELPNGALYTTTGWSIKLKYGSEQPSEEEWAEINVNERLEVPSIGTIASGNTDTYYPIWVRIYCPGNTSPVIKTDFSIKVSYVESVVQVPL